MERKSKGIKFKCVITKIKLNPEQAVLACGCSSVGFYAVEGQDPWYYFKNGYLRRSCGSGRVVYNHSLCWGVRTTNLGFRTQGHSGGSYS